MYWTLEHKNGGKWVKDSFYKSEEAALASLRGCARQCPKAWRVRTPDGKFLRADISAL